MSRGTTGRGDGVDTWASGSDAGGASVDVVSDHDPADRALGRTFAQRYTAFERIGQGGFGQVYRAFDRVLRRPVALKLARVDRPALTDEQARALLIEGQAAARTRQDGVVVVYDAGVLEADHALAVAGTYYLTTELLEGLSLGEWSRTSPPIDRWLDTMIALGEALASTHEAGVVHRDLTPSNVVVTSTGPKILDFGLAEALALGDVRFGFEPRALRAAGTRGYMSPEQSRGEVQTARTDIYAWGVVMYESLTGLRPVSGPDAELPPLGERRRDLPAALRALVHACMATEPRSRPTSAREVCRELEAIRRLVPTSPARPGHASNPYPGMRAYSGEETSYYFGRTVLIESCVERVVYQGGWLSLEAPSGRGKSSLARAGIVPALRERQTVHGPTLDLRPGVSLRGALCASGQVLGCDSTIEAVIERLRAGTAPPIVLVDQLEELNDQPPAEHALLVRLARAVLTRPDRGGTLVTTVRTDALERLEGLFHETTDLEPHRVPIPPMDRSALRDIVTKPAAFVDTRVEPELIGRLLDDVEQTPASLPLLAETLHTLWETHPEHALTLERYSAIGGLGAAGRRVGARVRAACQDVDALRRLLIGAVAHDGLRPRGRAVVRAEIRAAPALLELVLGRTGIPPLWHEEAGVISWVHESIISAWPDLSAWVEESRQALIARTELDAAALRWAERGRPVDGLLRGTQLGYYARAEDPTPLGAELLAASHRADRRRARTVRAAWMAALVVAVVVAIGLAVANRRTQSALAESQLALAESALRAGHRARARELARSAIEERDTVSARSLLWRLDAAELDWASSPRDAELATRGLSWRESFPNEVNAIAFAGDDLLVASETAAYVVDRATARPRHLLGGLAGASWIAAAPGADVVWVLSRRGATWRWQPELGLVERVDSPESRVTKHGAVVLPDGSLLVAEGAEGRGAVTRWPARGPLVSVLEIETDSPMQAVARSPSGAHWAAVTSRGALWVDGVLRNATGREFQGHLWKRGLVIDDRGNLVVASWDAVTRLHDASTGAERAVIASGTAKHGCMSLDAAGDRVAITTNQGPVLVFDLRRAALEPPLLGHRDESVCAHFGANGELATTGIDKTVRIWDVAAGRELRQVLLREHVQYAPLSPDGRWLATGDRDLVSVWWTRDTRERVPSGHLDPSVRARFGQDGRIYSTGGDALLRAWDATTGRELWRRATGASPSQATMDDERLLVASAHELASYSATTGEALSLRRIRSLANIGVIALGGGTALATNGYGQMLVLRDSTTLHTALAFDGDSLNALGASGDGRLLGGGHRGVLYVLSPTGSAVRTATVGPEILAIAVHPAHSWVAVAGRTAAIMAIELATGARRTLVELGSATSPVKLAVHALAFAEDGMSLVVGTNTGEVCRCDLAGGRCSRLGQHWGGVSTVDVRGDAVVSAGSDLTVRTWSLTGGRPLWRGIYAAAEPAEMVTHRGWEGLDASAARLGPRATAALTSADMAARVGPRLCVLAAGTLAAWDAVADRRVWGADVPTSSVGQVRADEHGCSWFAGRDGLARSWGGTESATRAVAGLVDAGWIGARPWWATTRGIIGVPAPTLAHDSRLAAVAVTDGGWLVGYEDGVVELYAGVSVTRLAEKATAQITRVALAGSLAVAGDADGRLRLWDADGQLLREAKLHGRIVHLAATSERIVALTDLGAEQTWSLAYFTRPAAELVVGR
jgi:serine/threonine protein kinase/WD40 repeat protein